MPRPAATVRLSLERLAWLQDGVVTRHQLREHRYNSDHVRSQLTARRWAACGRFVVVLHNGPLTERQRRWVGVLSQSSGALTSVTAANEHGLTGFPVPTVHVLIPHALFAAGVQQRLSTAERLTAEMAGTRPMRHRALLTHVLDDIAEGAHSFAEIDVGRLAKRAGLSPPRRQSFRLDRAGRRRWLDAEFDGFFVEIDGAIHLRPLSYWDDMERHNDLVIITGRPILRFATVAIRLLPATVEAQLRAADDRFGGLAS